MTAMQKNKSQPKKKLHRGNVGKKKEQEAGGSEEKKISEVFADGINRPAFISVGSSKTNFDP
eukprot:4324002-Ditylum_brightwellii.AAC.1